MQQIQPSMQPDTQQDNPQPKEYPGFAVGGILLISLSCFVVSSFLMEDVLILLGLTNRIAYFLSGALCSGLFFFLLPCVCLRLMRLSPFHFAGNYRIQSASQVFLWVGLGICCRLVILPLQLGWAGLLHLIGITPAESASVVYSSSFLLNAVCFAILPGIFEEFFFRGILFRSLEGYSRPIPAILLSSLAFALLHMDLLNIFPVLVLGGVAALALRYSCNLLSAILIHIVFNLTGILMSALLPSLASLLSGVNEVVLLTASAYVIPVLGIAGFVGCFFSFRALKKIAHRGGVPSFSMLYVTQQKKACMANTIVLLCCVAALFLASVIGGLV